MAPLPDNSTARVKIFYANAIANHVVNARYNQDGSIQGVTDVFQAVCEALSDFFHFNEVTAVQAAAVNSDIFLDVPGSDLVGFTWGSSPATLDTNPVQARFQGRSAAGRRVSLSLFAWKSGYSAYRLTVAELAEVGTAVAALQADDGNWIAIDTNEVTWKNYVNLKANDHWVKESRNG